MKRYDRGDLVIGLFLIAVALCATMGFATAAEAKTYRVKITAVTDGDTMVTDRMLFDDPVKVRLVGINTPEIRSAKCPEERAAGEAAKAYLQSLVDQSDKTWTMRDPFQEKYGRTATKRQRLKINGKSVDPVPLMIAAGHGVAYFGEKREPLFWCERLAVKHPIDLLEQVKP